MRDSLRILGQLQRPASAVKASIAATARRRRVTGGAEEEAGVC